MRAAVAAALTLVAGCSLPPPDHYSIDAEFSDEQEAVIDDTFDAWCARVGYCPEKVLWAEKGRVRADYNYPDRRAGSDACNSSRVHWDLDVTHQIRVDMSGDAVRNLTALWVAVAHEIGHYQIEGHLSEGIMRGSMSWGATEEMPLEIDDAAADAWVAQ